MKKIYLICMFLFSNLLLAQSPDWQALNLSKFVNPFIGTGGHGHTFPGAIVPFGMVQLSPDTRLTGWDGCSAYHYTDSIVYGFSHTHLSGTGCSDYGDILLMPFTGTPKIKNNDYCSEFKHSKEIATAGFYATFLEKYKIAVELTSTKRVGFHKYIFPKNEKPQLLIDLKHRDAVLESYFRVLNDTTIVGLRRSKAWARNQVLYFAVRFSKPFTKKAFSNDSIFLKDTNYLNTKDVKAFLEFKSSDDNQLLVKLALSAVDEKGALNNLNSEIPDWNFEKIKEQAKNEWNKELSKIVVEGGTDDQIKSFYTALYHCMTAPNIYSDVDGRYRGRDNQIHQTDKFDYYTVFSLWDTYRAEHPLFTIIDEKRTNDFINTFNRQFFEGGLLPVWELSSNETYCMIGYHAVPVIFDAYAKGIRNYNIDMAYQAMKKSSVQDQFGLDAFKENLYIPGDMDHESVSKTLEYGYDDWCIAMMAQYLGDMNEYKNYTYRAQAYKNLFDYDKGFLRARTNGGWYEPFDPTEVNNNYTEANCWQYSFYVPHDLRFYINMMGGKDRFTAKLDELFSTEQKLSGREQVDITGLIGQYAHGNEPSHHISYLYNYTGKPWKTQKMVRRIMDEMYNSTNEGLCGNEDCGQMSAWYVLSAMGFYQVCPGVPDYVIGSPLFDKVTIYREDGKQFKIIANNNSKINQYVQSSKLDGKDYPLSYFTHRDIQTGATLTLEMGSTPNENWGKDNFAPSTEIFDNFIEPTTIHLSESKTFKEKMKIEIKAANSNSKIYYTLDGSEPTINSTRYEKPVEIEKTLKLKSIAVNNGVESKVTSSDYFKIPSDLKISLGTKYNRQYTAGGPEGLIDGIRGKENFRLGGWQGYQTVNLDAVIDLGAEKKVKSMTGTFLQDAGSWIWMPTKVEFYVSDNNKDFKLISTIKNEVSEREMNTTIKDFKGTLDKKCRYVRIVAYNLGKIPDWHPGAGDQSFIFIDEINVDYVK